MTRRKKRQTCKEYRVIAIADLPRIKPLFAHDTDTATALELANAGIFEFDRGATNIQAVCVGYYCDVRGCGVDASGNEWPGNLIAGAKGLYRKDREALIEASLLSYKGGVNGGRNRLMTTPLNIESDFQTTVDNEATFIPAVNLGETAETKRLSARLPQIMGDG